MGDTFCELTDVVQHTRIGDGYTRYDTLIADLISVATTAIKTYCRREFTLAARTEYFATPHKEFEPTTFWLKEMNVAGSPAIDVRIQDGFYNNSFTTDWSQVIQLDPMYIDLDAAKGKLTILKPISQLKRGMRVVYTAGWAYDANNSNLVVVPDELRIACGMQTAFLLGLIVNQDTGQSEKNAQGTHKTLKLTDNAVHGLIPQVRALVAPFRSSFVGPWY